IHGYILYKHSYPNLSGEVVLGLDLGFQGMEQDYLRFNCLLSFKKKSPGRGKRGVRVVFLSED
ncbi:MAG: hypothetical protein LBC12_04475, partial [Nitrososphaerota archaeon]|nr:hypothetical protein [Nitrososphaerota archaeon]